MGSLLGQDLLADEISDENDADDLVALGGQRGPRNEPARSSFRPQGERHTDLGRLAERVRRLPLDPVVPGAGHDAAHVDRREQTVDAATGLADGRLEQRDVWTHVRRVGEEPVDAPPGEEVLRVDALDRRDGRHCARRTVHDGEERDALDTTVFEPDVVANVFDVGARDAEAPLDDANHRVARVREEHEERLANVAGRGPAHRVLLLLTETEHPLLLFWIHLREKSPSPVGDPNDDDYLLVAALMRPCSQHVTSVPVASVGMKSTTARPVHARVKNDMFPTNSWSDVRSCVCDSREAAAVLGTPFDTTP